MKPTEAQIAEQVKAVKLDHANKSEGEKCRFTPAQDSNSLSNVSDFENGYVMGLLETDQVSDTTNLPPGQYHMLLAKEGTGWQVYAVSGNKIVTKAKSVVERKDAPPGNKPQFSKGSFCWWVWLMFTGFQWCF